MINLLKSVKEDPEAGYWFDTALSRSDIIQLDPETGGSPKKFKSEKQNKESRALTKGIAFHEYVLEPAKFKAATYNRPSAKLGEVADAMVKLCMAGTAAPDTQTFENLCKELNYGQSWTAATRLSKFRDAFGFDYLLERVKHPDMHWVTQEEIDQFEITKESLDNHSFASELLSKCTEKEVILKFEINGIECKARLDMLEMSEDRVIVPDLKTTSQSAWDPYFIKKYGVDFQAAWYRRAALAEHARRYPGKTPQVIECYTILAELTPIAETVVYKLSNEKLNEQDAKIDSLINRYKFHMEHGFDYSMEELMNENRFLTY